jgi:hypothetical protein
LKLSVLYRGPLTSCNYTCWYCPFEKHTATRKEIKADSQALTRFVAWVADWSGERIAVFFTPWGEGLIWSHYQRALIQLTHIPHVSKAVIQTNLSCHLDWIEDCKRSRLALWATYHPSKVKRDRFLAQCHTLDQLKVRFSVGVVGVKEHIAEIESLRRELPPHIYLWVNAYKHGDDYYTSNHLERLQAIDPLFPINNQRHASQGAACRCGYSVVAVDGGGTAYRCHFIKTPIGNIYAPNWEKCLQREPCTNTTCGCHIGYVHMDRLRLYDIFGDGVLERIPTSSRRPF